MRPAAGILALALLGSGAAYAAEGYEPDGFELEVNMHASGETFKSSYDRKEIQLSPTESCLPGGEDWRELGKFTDHPFPYSTTTMGKKAGVLLGVGARAGFRLETHHLVFLHFDYMQERWQTRSETSWWDEVDQRTYRSCYSGETIFEVVRMSIGYRFSYPVVDWLEPFAVFEGGVRWYQSSKTGGRIPGEERFTLLLGTGVRFIFRERMFVSLSYLWELPLDWQTTNSVMIGMGAFFSFSKSR